MFFHRSGGGVSWLLVGLGNPGAKYASTRHNMGFLALDGLADREGFRFNKLRFRAWTAQWKVGDQQVLVMKPHLPLSRPGPEAQLVKAEALPVRQAVQGQ